MTEQPPENLLIKAFTRITGDPISDPNVFINTALLLIRLDLYPRTVLPETCLWGEEEIEITLKELIKQVATYLVSKEVTEILNTEHMKMPASIYYYAEMTPPKDAPSDEEVFPWLLPTNALSPPKETSLSSNKTTLMPPRDSDSDSDPDSEQPKSKSKENSTYSSNRNNLEH